MDLRIVRYRAWQMGILADPPPCQLRETGSAPGCWCLIEPAATVRPEGGGLKPASCPPRETDFSIQPTINVVVEWDET